MPPSWGLSGALALGLAGLAAPALAEPETTATVTGVVVTAEPAPEGLPISAVAISAETLDEQVNGVTAEDALRYLPNIFIRRRHIGDVQAPMTTRTSGVGASARSLIYADGVLLSALIGNNNSSASPRWGMVGEGDIARVDVLYGPFSAAYPGNSIGAVVNITTREPDAFEARTSVSASRQSFSAYSTDDDYATWSTSLSTGDRQGQFAWRLSWSHVSSEGQPLTYVTATRPASPSAAGIPVTGAFAEVNRTGAPIAVLGASGIETQDIDTLRGRLTWAPRPDLSITYAAGLFLHGDDARAETYLRGTTGAPVYAGTLNIGGYAYSVAPSAFSNGTYALDERHLMQSIAVRWRPTDGLRFDAILTGYDYLDDRQRLPTLVLPAATSGGAGAVVDLDGTGWRTADVTVSIGTENASHRLRFGAHYDRHRLRSERYATADWIRDEPGQLAVASRGRTETAALWGEDHWQVTPALEATFGLRWETWRASDGFNFSASPALSREQPARGAERTSPKLVVTWRPSADWALSVSAARAYRFPTVSELYQVVTTGPTLSSPDPTLNPEAATSGELSLERGLGRGRVRLTLFTETIDDALISQTAPVSPGSSTLASFVQNIGQVRSNGLEFVAEGRDIVRGLDLAGYVTYVRSEITDDPVFPAAVGKQTPQVPRWRAALTVTWRPTDRLSVTAGARYSTRVFATLDNSDSVTHTFQGFDPYLVVDLRARWRVTDQVSLAIGVDNAANDDYILFHPFPQRSMLIELQAAF